MRPLTLFILLFTTVFISCNSVEKRDFNYESEGGTQYICKLDEINFLSELLNNYSDPDYRNFIKQAKEIDNSKGFFDVFFEQANESDYKAAENFSRTRPDIFSKEMSNSDVKGVIIDQFRLRLQESIEFLILYFEKEFEAINIYLNDDLMICIEIPKNAKSREVIIESLLNNQQKLEFLYVVYSVEEIEKVYNYERSLANSGNLDAVEVESENDLLKPFDYNPIIEIEGDGKFQPSLNNSGTYFANTEYLGFCKIKDTAALSLILKDLNDNEERRYVWSSSPVYDSNGENSEKMTLYYLEKPLHAEVNNQLIETKHIENVEVKEDYYNINEYTIEIQFTEEGSEVWSNLTGALIGQPLAIVFNNKVLSAPIVQDRMWDRCSIYGGFDKVTADELAGLLKGSISTNGLSIVKKNRD
ncbi:hypothetical protein K6119_02300 [Paracrocinitomix mangrovi]|uniref:SecDF P1 head subdomain-containing protein n=1 Tax=Paracrocinitomix mangrovi TaxID=2862509 RepID=UPI001C8E603A|nr:hypothetical protein [Paracrocinitomix mangrovi]UKN02351.1 hypothetical protein K6119_02300 [Paracrocinitomix mangrovi]